jgi:serine/threonine-protein kinase HipA
MERELHVYMNLGGLDLRVGTLWTRSMPRGETSSFEYDRDWLVRGGAFQLDPMLPLRRGQVHTRGLFGAFADAAPDRWGEMLLQRNEDARARRLGQRGKLLAGADFLLGVEDETRLGALRFKEKHGAKFLSQGGRPVPPLIELRRLLSAASRVLKDQETEEDLQLLLAPGSSLGGQRPKASVRAPDGTLLIAKFPKSDDKWSVPRWEAAATALAAGAGITVASWRLEHPAKTKPVLLVSRFDRYGANARVPFMSAMTALGARDTEDGRSYLDLADVIRAEGAAPARDLKEMWRRMVFNVLISNADDHLRNHGFLRAEVGWHLSPAYDLNPCPDKRGFHALAFDATDRTASLATALSVAAQFGLAHVEATAIAAEVGASVRKWRETAKRYGIDKAEADRMAVAFEHAHLEQALANRLLIARPAGRKRRAKGAQRKRSSATPLP